MTRGHSQNLTAAENPRQTQPVEPVLDLPVQSTLQAPTDEEKQRILNEWNKTQRSYPQACLHDLFAAQAERTPDSVAVADEKQRLTYRELNARANQVARCLRKLGVGPEVLVGVALDRSVELLVALLGVMKAGGAYVPLDLDYPRDRLEFMVGDSRLRVVLTQAGLQARLPDVIGTQVCLDSDGGSISRESEEDFSSGAQPDNLVYVIYTSGSTGLPKGVQIEHRSLVNLLESLRIWPGFTGRDTFLATNTFSFDMSKPELYLALIAGGCVFVARRGIARDLNGFRQCLAASGATVLQGPPSFWRLLIESGWQGETALKILCGGEAWPAGLAMELIRRSPSVWNLYGPTETTVWSTVCRLTPDDACVPLGRPIANTQVHILDDRLEPVPVGVAGELYIGGDGLARGYLNRPELTAEKFIPNPFSAQPGARLYKTGDLARLRPDGNLEFVGRVDHQVKIRGYRVELGEIEAALGQHPQVKAAVVVMREDALGDRRLVAYVIATDSNSLTGEVLRCYLREKLPEYMLPARFELLDSFPVTPNGKVDRLALPPPRASRLDLGNMALPETESEEKLAGVFADVLGLERVSVEEDFFDLGGDSLLALRLIAEVEKISERRITLSNLFEMPTVRKLSAYTTDPRSSHAVPGALSIQPAGSRPPFFYVGAGPYIRPLGLRFGPDQPFWGLVLEQPEFKNLPVPFRLEDLAAILIRKMRAVQPKGPYYIGGSCRNAMFAHAMAQQLLASGDEVGLVVIVDPSHPAEILRHMKGEGVAGRLARVRQRWQLELGLIRQQGPAYFRAAVKRLRIRAPIIIKWMVYKVRLAMGHSVGDEMRDVEEVFYAAFVSHRPQPYPGPVAMIRSEISARTPCAADDDLGWRELVTGEFKLHFLPGLDHHEELYREPHAEVGARLFKSILSEAQAMRAKGRLANTVGVS
ncbi:MAG: amino acid adenylation domain-containing protein [Terriglobia bacterium]|jgi:amino acid adenylation domain-containing protein